MRKTFLAPLIVSAFFSASFAGAGAGIPRDITSDITNNKRLIQTAPNQKAWMSEDEIAEISMKVHEQGKCGGFMDVTDFPNKKRSFAVPGLDFGSRPLQQQGTVAPLLNEISVEQMTGTVEKLSSFKNRYYQSDTGAQAAQWIQGRFSELAGRRSDVQVQLFNHTAFKQPSVIARIQGRGPKANEIVVIGAHEDSVNWSGFGSVGNRVAPGADDDASGVATVLEAFRVLAQSGYRPDRTIEFMTYAGEERGLLGSQDIAQRYVRDGKQVVAVLQMDMTMAPGVKREFVLISDHIHRGLTDYTGKLIREYLQMAYIEEPCGYGCSDHASWEQAGFPAAFPFESPVSELNNRIHSEDDVLSSIDVAFGAHFAKLTVAFAVELASER